MGQYRQAKWSEPLIFALGASHRSGCCIPPLNKQMHPLYEHVDELIPHELRRSKPPRLPEVSEIEVVRHYTRLSQMNLGVDSGFYPLGSCTMKYNPKINDKLANLDTVHWIHPHQDESTVQGALEIMYILSQWLTEITGMYSFTLQPSAGAHGEYVGALIIRAFHESRGELRHRREIIVPDSAHGTNYTSAAMAGFDVVVVPSNERGCINYDALAHAVSSNTAGLMLTNPNTLGIFEENILEISQLIHKIGGLLYYDGANLNAVLGKARPGDMGFDIVHLNLHKTFATPHGGGGPGAGPVGVTEELRDYLPTPTIGYDGEKYYLNYNHPRSIGRVSGFYGNFEVLIRAFTYILSMGSKGLNKISDISVLNANYIAHQISKIQGFTRPFHLNNIVKHECVISCSRLTEDTGITAKHVAKRLLDFGVHAPTMYFPPIVDEALMIEPTETESLETLDRYIDIFKQISHEAYTNPQIVMTAPHSTSIPLVDEVKASHPRTICLTWRMFKQQTPI